MLPHCFFTLEVPETVFIAALDLVAHLDVIVVEKRQVQVKVRGMQVGYEVEGFGSRQEG